MENDAAQFGLRSCVFVRMLDLYRDHAAQNGTSVSFCEFFGLNVLGGVGVATLVGRVGGSDEAAVVSRRGVSLSSVCGDDVGVAAAVDVGGVCDGAGRGAADGVELKVRGRHYERNKRRREAEKRKKKDEGHGGCSGSSTPGTTVPEWRRSASPPSLAASVCTVDTRTAEELEAVRTFALRRVAENKLAARLSEQRLASFGDASKTEALGRLAAARMEQRINEAKAKSQASFKKCDQSLKSLGSTGSAGEFALKQEVKRGVEAQAMCDYYKKQVDIACAHLDGDGLDALDKVRKPQFQSEFEVFGDCPDDYDDEQRESYYMGLQQEQDRIDFMTSEFY